MLSILLPIYNEEKGLAENFARLQQSLQGIAMPIEFVLVDDGSRDGSWDLMRGFRSLEAKNTIHCLRFSRNFGKEAAIFAGLDHAQGDCVLVMDADLQHPPEKIPDMLALWQEGYQVVEGIKEDRGKESGLHRAFSKLFYGMLSRASGIAMENTSDFKLMDRKVVEVLKSLPERSTFFRALSFWTGFRRIQISYRVQDRKYGESKWSTFSLIRYALKNIASFSTFPMQLVTGLGFVLFVFSAVLALISLVQKIRGTALGGFTTVIILLGLVGSGIMFSLGIIGFYIALIYDEVRQRPRYILAEEKRAGQDVQEQ